MDRWQHNIIINPHLQPGTLSPAIWYIILIINIYLLSVLGGRYAEVTSSIGTQAYSQNSQTLIAFHEISKATRLFLNTTMLANDFFFFWDLKFFLTYFPLQAVALIVSLCLRDEQTAPMKRNQ